MKKSFPVISINIRRAFVCLMCTYSLSLTTTFAQGTWTPRVSLPDSARGYSIGFSIGNYGYVGLGTHNAHVNYPCLDDFWQFDPSTNSWTQKANFPGKARICPATFVIGNYGYVVTGQVSDSVPVKFTTECWRYNSTTNTWAQEANFPGSARAYDVGFAMGGKGYVGTGSDYLANYCKDFWAYDTTTNTWTQIADFGGAKRYSSSGFAIGGKGYLCFGRDSAGKWHKDMWEYDTVTNSWTQKSNYPWHPAYGASGFVIGNNIYLGTTYDSNNVFDNRFWQYNTLFDTWAEEASFPGISRTTCSAFAVGDTGYLGLGLDSASLFFNSIDRFYPDSVTAINMLPDYNKNINVYPNPNNGIFNFTMRNITGNGQLLIYNLMGVEVYKAFLNSSALSYTFRVNINDKALGVYLYRVLNEHSESIASGKFIIQ